MDQGTGKGLGRRRWIGDEFGGTELETFFQIEYDQEELRT